MGTDTYGPLPFPVLVPAPGEAAGDPVLRVVVDFAATVLNAYVQPAWESVCPRRKVVEKALVESPEADFFSDTHLPALYCFRDGGEPPAQDAADWRRTHDDLTLVWVFPLEKQTVKRLRSPIIAALTKAVDWAFYRNRDPAYVAALDTDPTARTYNQQPGTFLLQKSTSTAPQTYSGFGLDGPNAGQPVSPARGVIVDLGGDPASWVDQSVIRITGADVLGGAVTIPLVVTVSRIPGRLYTPQALTSLTSVTVDAQAGTAGTLMVGTGARQGYGTNIVAFAQFDLELVTTARYKPLRIPFKNTPEVRIYPAIEWKIRILERLLLDPADAPLIGAGIDQSGAPVQGPGVTTTLTNADGYPAAVGSFP